MARPSPYRHERDRTHVRPAADPAAAQDRPSETRDQSQSRSDRGDFTNAQDERARSGAVRASRRRSGLRDDPAVRGSACRDRARRDDEGPEESDASISYPLPIDPGQRGVGASSNGARMAGTGRTAAQTGDGIRSRRGDQEHRGRGARLLRGSQDVFGARTRWDGGFDDAAAYSLRGPERRARSTAWQAQHRRHRPSLGGPVEVATPALNVMGAAGAAARVRRQHWGKRIQKWN